MTMDFMPDAQTSLTGLLIASFLAATLLPGGSEAALLAVLATYPERRDAALLLATAGNTAGGMVSYAMGRFIPAGTVPARLALLQRHGTPALLLSWTPLIGDALCVAAGWLRLPPWRSALMMAIGKGARYAILAGLML
jgi:membrane protein YqaA with SNARE-associated domain